MFKHILVPTDGSEPARAAATKGIELAAIHGATVHVVYVIEPVYGTEAQTGSILETLREEGGQRVEELAEEAEDAGLATVTDVLVGTPHRQILEYADEHDVDLVVMGTHGRTGVERYLLGSVTEKVVRLSETPVLTVRSPNEE